MRSVAVPSTVQIFMFFYSIISQNTHKMRKIKNIHIFEILGHPNPVLTVFDDHYVLAVLRDHPVLIVYSITLYQQFYVIILY